MYEKSSIKTKLQNYKMSNVYSKTHFIQNRRTNTPTTGFTIWQNTLLSEISSILFNTYMKSQVLLREKKKLSCIIVTKTNKINSLVIIIYLVSITTPVKNLHKLSVYKYCTIFLNQPLIMFHCIMNICYTILLRHLHTYLVLCYKRDYLRYKRDYLCYKIDHLFKSFTQNQNFNMVNT